MRPQWACGRMAATSVTKAHAVAGLGSVVPVGMFPGAMPGQGRWQRCVVQVAKRGVRELKGRQVVGGRFASVSRIEAGEGAQFGLNEERGAVRGEEGLVSTVGTPSPAPVSFRDWYLADKQLVVVSFTAFVTAGFMGILIAAAIPSLLAIKKAAEALEKLADTAREELPVTMAAIRLSGMEISDLTMGLNGLGYSSIYRKEVADNLGNGPNFKKEILQETGIGKKYPRKSVVQLLFFHLPRLESDKWVESLLMEQAVVPAQAMQPLVARTARQVRDSLVQTRTLVRNLQVLSRVSGWIGFLQGRTPILIIPSDKKKHKS